MILALVLGACRDGVDTSTSAEPYAAVVYDGFVPDCQLSISDAALCDGWALTDTYTSIDLYAASWLHPYSPPGLLSYWQGEPSCAEDAGHAEQVVADAWPEATVMDVGKTDDRWFDVAFGDPLGVTRIARCSYFSSFTLPQSVEPNSVLAVLATEPRARGDVMDLMRDLEVRRTATDRPIFAMGGDSSGNTWHLRSCRFDARQPEISVSPPVLYRVVQTDYEYKASTRTMTWNEQAVREVRCDQALWQ